MDMNTMLTEMIEKKAQETIEKTVDDYIKSFEIDDVITRVVEEKLDKKFFDTDERLEDYIIKAINKDMFKWFENNLDNEDILDCIKQAIIEKMKDFSIEDLVELFNKVK